ncbi:MAG: hypothetical protein IPK72_23485 [Candidatus Eisenbacteria bacterium]|nr:hypothetical protein [Candidatus Eisenbacteria bacterium]
MNPSRADEALASFRRLVKYGNLVDRTAEMLTESDTRAKLIDPLFKNVLGWSETEIRREEPAGKGYADYILGAEYPYLLVEAKRTKPRFHLDADRSSRKLQLSGAHLLGQKKMKPHVEQAQRYAVELGCQFAMLTNGSQVVVFRAFTPGRAWVKGTALAWHDFKDIEQTFAEFYRLLARDSVCSGALSEEFDRIEKVTSSRFKAITYIPSPDLDLVRNPFWINLGQVIGPLLVDDPNDLTTRDEIIRNCYVTTGLSDQSDLQLDALLQDSGSKSLMDAGFTHIRAGAGGKTALDHGLTNDVQSGRVSTYLLTGGVGSGKTTFLRRFARVTRSDFVRRDCMWFHVDFLGIGNVSPSSLDSQLQSFCYLSIRKALDTEYRQYRPDSGEAMQALFAHPLEEARKSLLFGVPEGTEEWRKIVNEQVYRWEQDDQVYVKAILERSRASGRRLVFVLDNTDQLGETFQERVFLFAQRLSQEHRAICIVALREERFFAAYRRGIFDAFGERRFHIGSPSLSAVVGKRLEFGRERLRTLREQGAGVASYADKVDRLLETLIRSTTQKNPNIIRMLSCVSNGDMRYAHTCPVHEAWFGLTPVHFGA